MKILLLTLLLVSNFIFSQKNNADLLFISEIEKSIIEVINEHRIKLKDSSLIIKRESILDSASNYHNEYLKILNGDKLNRFCILHTEYRVIDGLTYTGSNEILTYSDDRVLKFDKEKKFYNVKEIIFAIGALSEIKDNPNRSSKIIANYILNSWLNSKDHKSSVESILVNKIGVSVYFNTESNTLCVVSVLSNKKLD